MAIQVTVYIVVFALRDSGLKVLLANDNQKRFKNRRGIPRVKLRGDESFEEAARRELVREVGANHAYLEQLHCSVDSKAKGDSGRAFSVAYYALLPVDRARSLNTALWHNAKSPGSLRPTQRRIVERALKRLRKRVEHNTAGFHLLARKFTLSELQAMYEAILGEKLDKRNFRKKMISMDVLRPLREWKRTGRKPARLYAVATRKLEKLEAAAGSLA